MSRFLSLLAAACLFLLVAYLFFSLDSEPHRQWYKGNTHTHSLWSDGNDFPEMIVDWYHRENYHFLALSDHNILSRGEKWMEVGAIRSRQKAVGRTALQKLEARYGAEWIERRMNDKGKEEVRLRALEEFRGRYEEPGKFLLIEAEEVTDGFRGKPVHLNAINLKELIPPQKGGSVVEVIRNNYKAVEAQEARTGQKILMHINHPNFGWGITPNDVAQALEARYFEVYNGHPSINHLGDAEHPGDERLWDLANTLRLTQLNAPPLYGLGTDDSHTYHGGDVSPGRGWIMVHATKLDPEALITAMRAGRFYASSGVSLDKIRYDAVRRELRFQILPDPGVTYETKIIGSRPTEGLAGTGVVLATSTGTEVRYQLKEGEIYARATVTSSTLHPNPSYKGQKKQAWTQPVGWKPTLAEAAK